jgi:hypothetical protein
MTARDTRVRRTRVARSARPGPPLTRRPSGAFLVTLLALVTVRCSTVSLQADHSAVIPAQNARLMKLCSRPGPSFDHAWEPSAAQIADLEADLPMLASQTARGCCLNGFRITDLASSWRQYLGVVVNGKRLIYINGFSAEKPGEHWKTEPVIICDGGGAAWGALYDPATRRFSDLALNGVG